MSGYAVHAQAWGDVRPEGTATTQASVPAALWKVAKVATSVDVAELVGSLLAAPVTEPASVAELREAAATHLAAWDAYMQCMDHDEERGQRADLTREALRSILARLYVTGPVAQRGEADEESAAREAVVEAALASEIDLGHYDARTRLRLESAVRKLRVVLAKKGAV